MAAQANGHVVADGTILKKSRPSPPRKVRAQRRGYLGRGASILARLFAWYSIVTILLRCPSAPAGIRESSPRICKPYFEARSYIYPYVAPYYDAYAADYVNAVRPYAVTLDRKILTPAVAVSKRTYQNYGAPRVEQARRYGDAEWQRTIRPRMDQVAAKAATGYNAKLAPHVNRMLETTSPYYGAARDNFLQTYYAHILPAYTTSVPYAQQAYALSHSFMLHTGLPYANSAWNTVSALMNRTIWPRIRILYGENVEPQLVRIGERLGRYRDRKRLEAVVNEADRSAHQSSEATEASSILSSIASKASATAVVSGKHKDKTPSVDEEDEEKVREIINNDLKAWQEKFAKASDKGAEDLEQRVAEIADRQIEKQVRGVGQALLIELEEAVQSGINGAKAKIISTVGRLSEDAGVQELEEATQEIVASIRAAGLSVKGKAQAIRTWKQKFNNETLSLVWAATESTLAVIDNIRDLGLQEVGMKWAWMEGVTYKDWSRYHALRKTFDDWRKEVQSVAWKHEGLARAGAASDDLENTAMAVAENAAKELARLKNVGQWKIKARDVSDDFSNAHIPAAAARARVHASEKLSEAGEAIRDSLNDVSERVLGHQQPATETLASVASSKAAQASSYLSQAVVENMPNHAPKKVWGGAAAKSIIHARDPLLDSDIVEETDKSAFSDAVQSMAKHAGESLSEMTEAVKEALLKPPSTQGTLESATSIASEQYSRALSAASSVLYGTQPTGTEKIASIASKKYADAVSAASSVIYGTPTGNPYLSAAQEQYSGIISGASAQYSSVLSSASTAYYGTSQGALESITSIASARLAEGLSLASAQYSSAKEALLATPTPAHNQYVLDAQRRYYEAVGLAHDRYSVFVRSASSAVYGTPTPTYQKLYDGASDAIYATAAPAFQTAIAAAESQYSNAVAAASSRLAQLVGQASSASTKTNQSPISSLLSAASSRYSEALAAASSSLSSASEAASTAIYGRPTGSIESLASAVSQKVESVASLASSHVVGTETPWTESMASVASQNWESLISKASEQIYGSPTPFTQSLMSRAGDYAAQATDGAAAQLEAMRALVSELVVGREPDFTESVMNRFSSAFYTGAPGIAYSASSLVSGAYESATSVVASVFTPPPAVEAILEAASSQISAAVEAASVQVYGTSKGRYEKATSAAADAYSSAQTKVSEAVYGTQTGYVEAAQSQIGDAVASAQSAISVAIYGTPTGTAEHITSAVAGSYASASSVLAENLASASSVASEQYSAAVSRASVAIYGPEKGAVESAQNKLSAAVESARARLSELVESAGDGAKEAVASVKQGMENIVSGASSVVVSPVSSILSSYSSSSSLIKDEL